MLPWISWKPSTIRIPRHRYSFSISNCEHLPNLLTYSPHHCIPKLFHKTLPHPASKKHKPLWKNQGCQATTPQNQGCLRMTHMSTTSNHRHCTSIYDYDNKPTVSPRNFTLVTHKKSCAMLLSFYQIML